jgi:hypothetical protein
MHGLQKHTVARAFDQLLDLYLRNWRQSCYMATHPCHCFVLACMNSVLCNWIATLEQNVLNTYKMGGRHGTTAVQGYSSALSVGHDTGTHCQWLHAAACLHLDGERSVHCILLYVLCHAPVIGCLVSTATLQSMFTRWRLLEAAV